MISMLAAAATAVLYAQGPVQNPEGAFAKGDGKTCTLSWDGTGQQPVLALDFGAKSVGGYAVIHVTARTGDPVLRLAYANHPDGLGERGCFWRETSARYLGPTFDIPVLPGNINRHELYRVCREGQFVAPLIQGQQRYVRVQLDTPGRVAIDAVGIENAEVFSTEPRRGSFACSDDRITRLWDISVWTCQLASFPNHDAWKKVGGWILPRKLEQAAADVWCRKTAPADGMLEIAYEFDANPHFPKGVFEVLHGGLRTKVMQESTNAVATVKVPVKKGERLGLSVPKESWPVIRAMSVAGQDLMDLADWDFARTLPFTADGAKRDRLIWSGDLWWAERNLFYGFGPDSPYMKGNVKMLAFNRTPEGYTHASPYAERSVRPPRGDYGPFGSDEFAAWFIPVAWDHLLYTADYETLKLVWPDVVALVGYLNAHRRGDGIFEPRKETCKHAAGLVFGGTSLHHRSYMNILLWKTLKDAASIARCLGHVHEADVWSRDADKFAPVVRQAFWDEAKGFFALSQEQRHMGFEANALALATRFATPQEAARIRPQLVRTGHGKFQALAARGKFEYGDTAGGLKAIEDHNWYKLLDPDWKGALTVTECMGLIRRGWGDESHPDTAIGGIYSSYLLGVVPTAPGFRTFSVRPQTAGLTWAEGVVPTPRGDIRVRWDRRDDGLAVKVAVPPTLVAEFTWGATAKTLPAGEHAFLAK
ncbi:MAG: alpha-L-rhamnosidase C-terminal domain-containing protein [Kiritimatiellae bacterium]|nr:alpha-L-rhamnosidase C-terminal domain-containing protein [Kiritimatiellia bacterium]